MRILVIGAGKVGLNLAALCIAKRVAVSVIDPAPGPHPRGIRVRTPDETLAEPNPDLIVAAVPDSALGPVAAWLDQRLPSNVPAVATSGFAPLPPTTRPWGRMHPAFSFADAHIDLASLARSAWLATGPQTTVDAARRLLQLLHVRAIDASPENPALYHAGCVLAANAVSACLAAAETAFSAAGLAAPSTATAVDSLAGSAVSNAARLGAVASATGPAPRNDADTLLREADLLAPSPHVQRLFLAANALLAHNAGHTELAAQLTKRLMEVEP